jgi:hypothetical protein
MYLVMRAPPARPAGGGDAEPHLLGFGEWMSLRGTVLEFEGAREYMWELGLEREAVVQRRAPPYVAGLPP